MWDLGIIYSLWTCAGPLMQLFGGFNLYFCCFFVGELLRQLGLVGGWQTTWRVGSADMWIQHLQNPVAVKAQSAAHYSCSALTSRRQIDMLLGLLLLNVSFGPLARFSPPLFLFIYLVYQFVTQMNNGWGGWLPQWHVSLIIGVFSPAELWSADLSCNPLTLLAPFQHDRWITISAHTLHSQQSAVLELMKMENPWDGHLQFWQMQPSIS